ncbi:MAG: hypothetical protein AB1556_00640 [Bacillota bacterium]
MSEVFGRAVFWGIISLAAYRLVFFNQQTVTHYLTQGGFWALAVVATALVFYFIHGAFANFLFRAIGLRAGKTIDGEEN